MIWIMEGPDGSGKTTLANYFARQMGIEVVHRVKPENQADKDAMLQSYLNIISRAKSIILDRSWYSEMVYGPIMRDESVIAYDQMMMLERALTEHGAIICYCTGNRNNLWDRATSRGEDYITDAATFYKICDGYDELFSKNHIIPIVRYSVDSILGVYAK